jgi:hypothetical protein
MTRPSRTIRGSILLRVGLLRVGLLRVGLLSASVLSVSVLSAGLLSACASASTTAGGTGGLTGVTPSATGSAPTGTSSSGSTPSVNPTPAVTLTKTAPAAPKYYFANGKSYAAWVTKVSGSTLTIEVVHHLTGTAAADYLTSHGQTLGPDGVPDDYINVDTHVKKVVQLSSSATPSTNEEGAGPVSMSASAFLTWLSSNLAKPIASGDQDPYVGAPQFFGPLFAVKFTNDVMVSADQIFEP